MFDRGLLAFENLVFLGLILLRIGEMSLLSIWGRYLAILDMEG